MLKSILLQIEVQNFFKSLEVLKLQWNIEVVYSLPFFCDLLQANNCHLRDQWLHSVQWKVSIFFTIEITMNTILYFVLDKKILL